MDNIEFLKQEIQRNQKKVDDLLTKVKTLEEKIWNMNNRLETVKMAVDRLIYDFKKAENHID